ncbi:MAG: ParB/RepB/Spo0J family partition protein [Litoreibacter sp.]|nr:ParB/RepB/Spo0J family partition protein [Litoreibacter sp.]
MAQKKEKRGLGRGLSALMADVDLGAETSQAGAQPVSTRLDRTVPIEAIVPNPDQPRRDFDKSALQELADSIREKGIIQPLIVRTDPKDGSRFQIVAGERRWRAAQMAQVHEIPVVLRDFNDTEVLEIAIIENIQRADLNPVEEALGYRQLQEKFGHTQEQLAQALGKSRSHIANLMRLLTLPDAVLKWLREGALSIGHARALITAEDPVSLAKSVIDKGLSVRETEALMKQGSAAGQKATAAPVKASTKDADTVALEKDIAANLGMKVTITHRQGGESGKVTVDYKDFAELDELCRRLIAM